MTILLQRLFLVVFLFGALLPGVDGQSRGIFKDKSKVEGEGGQDVIYLCKGEQYIFSIQLSAKSTNLPCDMYIGLTNEDGETILSPIEIEEFQSNGKTSNRLVASFSVRIPEQECVDGQYTVSFELDLYCPDDNGDYVRIVPCDSDLYDDFLPYDWDEECSLATEYSVSVGCCWDDQHQVPEPETPKTPRTQGRSSDCNGDSNINVLSLDGRNIYIDKINGSEEKENILKDLNIKSGLYFIVTEKCGVVTTQKVFKN